MTGAGRATSYRPLFSQVRGEAAEVARALRVAAEPLPAEAIGWGLVALVGWALWYALACWIWPFARCLMCKGQGRVFQNERKRTWRNCRWCKGSGRRLRWGRWIYAKSKSRRGS